LAATAWHGVPIDLKDALRKSAGVKRTSQKKKNA
jgi:hypothetical protein